MLETTYGPSDGSDHTLLPAAPQLPTEPGMAPTGADPLMGFVIGAVLLVAGAVALIVRKGKVARGEA